MHLVKLEEIPGAKEELKKIRSRRYIMISIRVLFVCHGRAMESQ